MLSWKECGFYCRVPPPIAPGVRHMSDIYLPSHLIISKKPATTENMFLIRVRAAISKYTFLPLLESAVIISPWRLPVTVDR